MRWVGYPATREAGAECSECGERLVVWDVDHVPQEMVETVIWARALGASQSHRLQGCEPTDDVD